MSSNFSIKVTNQKIKAKHPQIALLILTVHDDEEYIVQLLEAGGSWRGGRSAS